MPRAKRSEINAAIQEMENKYYTLVWYARKRPEDYAIPGVLREVEIAKFKYPDETEALASSDTGDWQHGFHSGMLAALRFVLTAQELGMETAQEWFPELDS